MPVQQIEFLSLEIDSLEISLERFFRKVKEIVQMSQNALEGSLTIRDLTKLLGKLTSTIQATLQAKFSIPFLQQIQIQALRKNMTNESAITLDQQAKEELSWGITNMKIYNGKSLLIIPPDESKKGWGASCQRINTGSCWSSVEKARHINVLDLKAVRLAVLSFTKFKKLN